MLTLVLLLAAIAESPKAAAPAEAAKAPAAPVAIETFEQASDLCASLRGEGRAAAAQKSVRTEVPSNGFVFGRYRSAESELELDGDRPLRAASSTLMLDLAGIDEVAFTATPEQVAEWKRAKEDGNVKLEVVFRPSADGCTGNKHARHLRLAGRPESWRLVGDKGQTLAAADDEGKPGRVAEARAAKVTSVAFEGEPPRPDEGREKLAAAQGALDACAKKAARPGSLVLAFSARGGAIQEVQVLVDGVRDQSVTECIAKAVSGARLAGAGKGTAVIAVE